MRKIKIIGMGKYLPKKVVQSKEIDEILGISEGWTEKKSGVKSRHYVEDETASYMAEEAIKLALSEAGLTIDDIDCIVSVSGTMEQPIPCTASLIHERLKPKKPIPAFDVNSTCLSFVTGLDVMSHLIHNGTYNKVIFVSSEIASVGINPKQKESYVLFGDAACACIVERAENENPCGILSSSMETYSKGAHYTEIRGGGTKKHPNSGVNEEEFLFDMNGKEVFRMSSKHISGFVDELLKKAGLNSIDDIDFFIPHQASGMALRIIKNKLSVSDDKFINVISTYGNTIASSIPLALHDTIKSGKVKRGDKIMLLGTSAGLSLGGIILEY